MDRLSLFSVIKKCQVMLETYDISNILFAQLYK